MNEKSAISYASGAEHVGHSEGSLSVAILLSPDAILAGEAARLGLAEPSQCRGTARWIDPDSVGIRALRIAVERAIAVTRDGRVLEYDGARSGLRATLLRLAATVISEEPLSRAVASGAASRTAIVRRAREYLDSRLTEPVYVADVCAETGVSERTLRYAFRDIYGVGPNRYLLLRRLHAARQALRDGDPRLSVTEVATSLGFWDLGRFAGYYRAVFGDSPSTTLRNAARRQARP